MMRGKLFAAASGLVALLSIASAVAAPSSLEPADRLGGPARGSLPDRYVVVLKEDATPGSVAAAHGVRPSFVYTRVFNGFAGSVPLGRLKALQDDPRVESVTPDHMVSIAGKPSGQGKGSGGGSGVIAQSVPPNITRVGAAPGTVAYTGSGVSIAVIDTGVDINNPDLKVSLAPDCFDAFGGNCSDGNGHGTHVAGIAAALNNSRDVVGVAPGATIVPVRVLNTNGSGSDSSVIAGLDWVAANAGRLGIKVANASLGRAASADDSAMHLAVQGVANAGVVLVVAAGNDANVDASAQVPGAFAEAIAVASTTAIDGSNACRGYVGTIKADTASYFTSDGGKVAVSAPGEEREDISRSCFIQGTGVLSLKPGGGTTRMSGTSMASPHVAGLAALLAEAGKTPACITSSLSATDRPGVAPLDSPASSYTFDGTREGVGKAANALAAPC